MISKNFTPEQLKRRKCNFIANLLFQVHQEEIGIHTRVSEMIIWDAWATIGSSGPDSKYREHVVPLCYLTRLSRDMFKAGKSPGEVEQLWYEYYLVAFITKEEAKKLNATPGLKFSMPQGWKLGDDPRQRLWQAGIFLENDLNNSKAG